VTARTDRSNQLRRGVWLEMATVGWNIVEGLVAVSAGALASSVALNAFGIDSFAETASGAVVGWRLRTEQRGADDAAIEHLERRTGALRADAYETIACAWLSLTTLAGLGLNAVFGWWWADPVAALAIVPLIVREGLEGVRRDP